MPPLNVLLVEDNLAHQKITEYALKKNSVPVSVAVVRDGQEVLDYLFHRGTYTDLEKYPAPDLILLDFNLPKRDGREVLKLINEDASLRRIPVVVLTTSDREEDLSYARQQGAVAYISKSSGFDAFSAQVATVAKYASIENH